MTSPVDTSVKYCHSGMAGAPVVNGSAGSMIALLDAVLVNGFGLVTVESLTISSGVATCNISAGSGATPEGVVLIAGATPAALNGEQKVTTIGTNKVMFATALPDQTATGSISLKIAPAGWTKPFSGANKAVYRYPDVQSSRFYLRVDDSFPNNTRVRGYESMSDVDAGTGAFPNVEQQPAGPYWPRANDSSLTARSWSVFADGRGVIVALAANLSTPTAHNCVTFGELIPTKANDPFCCILNAHLSDETQTTQIGAGALFRSIADVYEHSVSIVRSVTGVGSAIACAKYFPVINCRAQNYISGVTGGITYPNSADGGMYLSRVHVTQQGMVFRGVVPGIYPVAMDTPAGNFSNRQLIQPVEGLPGRKLAVVVNYGSVGGSPCTNPTTVDVTGPWR